MAINATAAWRIRTDGNNSNGGGYDASITGGSDLTDQATAALSLTDLATSAANATTITSATGGFTASMIGNCIRISSGTNFTAGYYFITAVANTNTVTVDRTPTASAAGSAGAGSIGGAWLDFTNLPTNSTITSPLTAGNTIYIRGSGSNDPSTVDYDWSAFPYASYANGTPTAQVAWAGYNGRPNIKVGGLLWYSLTFHVFTNLKITIAGTNNGGYGVIRGGAVVDLIFDQNNYDCSAVTVCPYAIGVTIRCTGNTGGGTQIALTDTAYGGTFRGINLTCKGVGIQIGNMGHLSDSVIHGCGGDGVQFNAGGNNYGQSVINCALDNCAGNGINFISTNGLTNTAILNNTITNNTGSGINLSGTASANALGYRYLINYNAYYNNGSNYTGVQPGANDVLLTASPYNNPSAGDYTLNNTAGGGAACQGAGFPQSLPS